jgi:hypothetical protein
MAWLFFSRTGLSGSRVNFVRLWFCRQRSYSLNWNLTPRLLRPRWRSQPASRAPHTDYRRLQNTASKVRAKLSTPKFLQRRRARENAAPSDSDRLEWSLHRQLIQRRRMLSNAHPSSAALATFAATPRCRARPTPLALRGGDEASPFRQERSRPELRRESACAGAAYSQPGRGATRKPGKHGLPVPSISLLASRPSVSSAYPTWLRCLGVEDAPCRAHRQHAAHARSRR